MPMISSFYDDPLLGLHDLEIIDPPGPAELTDNPDPEEKSIHEEYLEFADLEDLVQAADALGKLEDLRRAVGRHLIRKQAVQRVEAEMAKSDEQKAIEAGYPAVTLKYHKLFYDIRERARAKIAYSEDPEWEVIYRSENSEQSGPSKRNWIVKNKDRYLLPGVWCVSSHQSLNEYGKFLESQCTVKYMADAPASDPESILIVPRRSGRPSAPKNENTII